MLQSPGRIHRLVVVIAAVILLGWSGSSFAQAPNREIEPNDSPATANVLPLPTITVSGTVDTNGTDVDFWETTLVEGNVLRVGLAGMSDSKFQGRIDLLNTSLVTECDGGFNDGAACSVDLECQVQCSNPAGGVCIGGTSDGLACSGGGSGTCPIDDGACEIAPVTNPVFGCNTDNIRACDPTATACNAGFRRDLTCFSDVDCIETPTCVVDGGTCVDLGNSTVCQGGAEDGKVNCQFGLVPTCETNAGGDLACVGGPQNGDACEVVSVKQDCPTDCPPDQLAPFCDTTADSCVGGANAGGACNLATEDVDCPAFTVCAGGTTDGDVCAGDSSCIPESGTCSIFDALGQCGFSRFAECTVDADARRGGSSATANLQAFVGSTTPPGTAFLRVRNTNLDTEPNNTSQFYTLNITQGLPEAEPNDDPGTAQAIGLDFPLLGLQSTQKPEVDFYTFDTTQPQTAIVALEYPLNALVVLGVELSDSTGEIIASAFRTSVTGSGTPKNPSIIQFLEEPGTYFLKVLKQAPATIDVIVNYSLFLFLNTGQFESEPNQSFPEAFPITLAPGGSTVSGFLQVAQDVDVYRLNVPAGRTIVADVEATSPFSTFDGVVSGFVTEDLGVAFVSNDTSSVRPQGASFGLLNNDGYVRVTPPRGGDIFFAIGDRLNRGGPVGFAYEVTFELVDSLPREVEPNNTVATATALPPGQVFQGQIDSIADVDLFSVNGNAGDSLLVNINAFGIGSFLDARLILRDDTQTVLFDESTSAFSLDPFALIVSLPKTGVYTIEIRRRSGTTGTGPSFFYEVQAQTGPALDAVVANPDIDGSSRVDGFDLADLSRRFGAESGQMLFSTNADLLPDGKLDGQDIAVLGSFFGSLLPPGLGSGRIVADTAGDAVPFFGPAEKPVDLIGLATGVSGTDLSMTSFFADPVGPETSVLISVDIDATALTGSLGTPDAYVVQNNLGSEVELFVDSSEVQVFGVPDGRADVLGAFLARVGSATAQTFVRSVPVPVLLATLPTQSSGNLITANVPLDLLGGSGIVNLAALAVVRGANEPTDRLPNSGKIAFAPTVSVTAIPVSQMLCDGPRTCSDTGQTCSSDLDCITPATCTLLPPVSLCETGPVSACSNDPLLPCDATDLAGSCGDALAACVAGTVCPFSSASSPVACLDGATPTVLNCSNDNTLTFPCDPSDFDPCTDCPGGCFVNIPTCATFGGILPSEEVVYLRVPGSFTPFTDHERGQRVVTSRDTGETRFDTGRRRRSNDTLDHIFPPGVQPESLNGPGNDFTRDLLANFGVRNADFDPHTFADGRPPPDTDLYYFVGSEGDRAIIDVTTADAGQSFDSRIEIFSTPVRLSVLDPSSADSKTLTLADDELVFLAATDDKSPTDLDPHMAVDLPATGIYLVRITASPNQTAFPGVPVDYVLYHESLRADEISIPIIIRGPYNPSSLFVLRGLAVQLEFDPTIVSFAGVDSQRGLRRITTAARFSTATEVTGQVVSGVAGNVRIAVRSFDDGFFSFVNGLGGEVEAAKDTSEITIARVRFRAVGVGTTQIRFVPNSAIDGAPVINLGIQGPTSEATVFQPKNGFGPGVTVTVEGS